MGTFVETDSAITEFTEGGSIAFALRYLGELPLTASAHADGSFACKSHQGDDSDETVPSTVAMRDTESTSASSYRP